MRGKGRTGIVQRSAAGGRFIIQCLPPDTRKGLLGMTLLRGKKGRDQYRIAHKGEEEEEGGANCLSLCLILAPLGDDVMHNGWMNWEMPFYTQRAFSPGCRNQNKWAASWRREEERKGAICNARSPSTKWLKRKGCFHFSTTKWEGLKGRGVEFFC